MLDWKRYRTDLASSLSRLAIITVAGSGVLLFMLAFLLGYFVLLAQSPWWLRGPVTVALTAGAILGFGVVVLLVVRATPRRYEPPSMERDGIRWVWTGEGQTIGVGLRPECPVHGIELMARTRAGEFYPMSHIWAQYAPYCARGHELSPLADYRATRDQVWVELAAVARLRN